MCSSDLDLYLDSIKAAVRVWNEDGYVIAMFENPPTVFSDREEWGSVADLLEYGAIDQLVQLPLTLMKLAHQRMLYRRARSPLPPAQWGFNDNIDRLADAIADAQAQC